MKRKPIRKEKRRRAKAIQRLPDPEVAKSAVLNSLSCPDAQRGYRHAIDEFVEWYCSEPRLSFGNTVVVRYRTMTFNELSRQLPIGDLKDAFGDSSTKGMGVIVLDHSVGANSDQNQK
jgi:hypothetical protein